MHTALEEFRDVDLSEESNMTLGDWLDRWLKEYAEPTLRPNTVRGYTRNIENHIRPVLGDNPIRFITTADVQKLYNNTKKNGRKNPGGNTVRSCRTAWCAGFICCSTK